MNNCSICNKPFEDSELLQSNQDEYFCKECFKYEYCLVSNRKKAVISNRCKGDSETKPRKMFSPDDLSMVKEVREARVNRVFTSKRDELSQRQIVSGTNCPERNCERPNYCGRQINLQPIFACVCPHIDCNRHVSIFDLNAHFQYEHMDIPIVKTTLEARNPLIFNPRDIRYGINQCLVLLNTLPVQKEDANGDKKSQTETKKPPITVVVLASRIACVQLGDESDCLLDEDEKNNLLFDKIVIWTASNVMCNYSYTVAVSTVSEDIRVKYYGPILQLGNNAKDLCKEGQCLILSHFHFLGMSENGTKPLNLNIIIHSED